ncbi:MAG: 30S ribosomal protein S8 [bacterium]|nr:30S ribosomal protein S8 [bacterium]
MIVNDPIADMLTRIRNAFMVRKESVLIPDSRLKREVLSVMKNKHYINDFSVSKEIQGFIDVKLSYGERQMKKLERVSKPGCRVYAKKSDIPTVLQGMGMVIMSTSKGVMAGTDAKKQGLGGEIICKIY